MPINEIQYTTLQLILQSAAFRVGFNLVFRDCCIGIILSYRSIEDAGWRLWTLILNNGLTENGGHENDGPICTTSNRA